MKLSFRAGALAFAVATLAACGNGGDGGTAQTDPRVAQTDSRAQQQLALYEQLRTLNRFEQAVLAGETVLRDYPNSTAADTVRATIDDVRTRAQSDAAARRLTSMWTYHAVQEEGGGTSYTAQIYRSGDKESSAQEQYAHESRLRLVMRRHPEWGESVYLQTENGGRFQCGSSCTVKVAFDDAAARDFSAKSTQGGGNPPTLFIDDTVAFINGLDEAATVTVSVPFAQGGTREATFEVGGFDIGKLGPPVKKAG